MPLCKLIACIFMCIIYTYIGVGFKYFVCSPLDPIWPIFFNWVETTSWIWLYIIVWYWNSCLSTSANVCPTLLQECTVKAHPEGPILAFLGFVLYISFCWTKYAMVNVQTWNMWSSILSHSQLLQITSLQMVQERLFQSRQDFPNKGEGSAVW